MVERAHTARHGTNPEIARRRIEAFARRFGQAHLRFAQHAAFPLALTPDLAYRLWANFQRDIYGEKLGIPWIAVADLLLSSLCEEVGHELYEMQSAIRNILLGELQANPDFGPARVRELSHFLLKQIERQLASPDPDIRDLAVAQQWTALTYIHPDDAVRELAQALRVSLEQQDIPEQLRLASLIETFTQPLADAGFAPLLTYTRGVERLAHGDTENARAHFSQIATTETSAEIQGMSLPLPQLVHEQDRAIAEQTGKKPPASSQPGSVPISAESTSKLQQRIYDFLVEYIQTRGRPPTRREIAQAMNIASLGHVDLHLALLEKKGLIRHEAKKSRGITLVQPPLVDAPMTESGDAQETNSESNGSIDTSVPTTEPETSIAKLAALNEKILVTQNFANAFHQLTEKKRAITAQKIEFLFHNPRHPSLHTKRLQSRVWVCSIDSKTRLLYQIQQDTLRLWYLGNHEIVERIDRLNFAPSTSFSPFSELSAMRPEADNIQHPSEHPEKSQFPLRVFYSSATVDKKWLERLKQYLQPLKQEGLIVDWGSFEIRAGEERKAAIDRHLNAADIILLLISSAFLASDFCYGIEMKRAIERSQAREAHVIPILLRPVADWPKTLFGTSQALPRNGKSVSSWSNPDEAFLDIVNGIRQLIEEIAERPATSTYPREPRIWNVPYPRNPLFTGGEAELQAIADALKTGKRASLGQAISGLGGIGKTQLALEYAYRHRNEYQYVFWLLADTRESLDAGYSNLAVLLALPRASRPGQRFINEAVKGWLATHSGWLLVLDNADDLSLIDEYLPPACPGHLLLTTRARSVGGPIEHIEVARLSASESVSFLLRRSSLLGSNQSLDTISSDQLALAQEIVRELGELPLALDQAGAYIEETNCGLQGYLRLYNKERQELLRIRGNWTASHPESVATTWQLAFDKVEKADFAAADLLRLCAFLAPSNIPEAIIVAGEAELTEPLKKLARNPLRLNAAVAELQKYSLISRDSATSMLSVHHLVQAVLRDAMANSVERAWALRTMRILNCVFPTPIQGNREKCELLLPHVIVCTELIERWQMDTREASQLLQKAGAYLIQQGKYKEAEALIQQSLAIQERTVGLEHLDVVTTLNNLAMIYRGQGKNEQAELLFQRALAIRRNVLGEEHPETAVSLNNLPELQENRRISQEKMDRGEYDVFISYNHQDRERVLEIGELLKDHGLAPFLDEWSLRPGLTWQTALEEQVRTVKAAAICIGAAGMGSWHRKEMDAFERECEKRSLPVIPVLLPDIPSHKDLPIFLEGMTRVDFREKDPDPLERLIWGITGGIVNLLRGWKSL